MDGSDGLIKTSLLPEGLEDSEVFAYVQRRIHEEATFADWRWYNDAEYRTEVKAMWDAEFDRFFGPPGTVYNFTGLKGIVDSGKIRPTPDYSDLTRRINGGRS